MTTTRINHTVVHAITGNSHEIVILQAVVQIRHCDQIVWTRDDRLFVGVGSDPSDWEAGGSKTCGGCGRDICPSYALLVDPSNDEIENAELR